MAAKKQKGETGRLQITIDAATYSCLTEISKRQFLGTSEGKVAHAIIRDWLLNNEKGLKSLGLELSTIIDKFIKE